MDHDDQMTDGPELQELRDALSSVGMPGRPSLAAIERRGRAWRRRRRARAARFGIGAVVLTGALALSLSLAAGPGQRLETIRRAAYTLHHDRGGTDTLSLNPVELLDPSQLQSDLARYGIAAKVTTDSYCTTTPEPAGFSAAVTPPGPADSGRVGSSNRLTITIDPSRIPAGTELSIGSFVLTSGPAAGEQQADMSLISVGSHSCADTPPDLSQPDTGVEGFGLLYGTPARRSPDRRTKAPPRSA